MTTRQSEKAPYQIGALGLQDQVHGVQVTKEHGFSD